MAEGKGSGSGYVAQDLSGRRFGRLVVVGLTGERAPRGLTWFCLCDCGGCNRVTRADLTRGKVRSCGCLQTEQRARGNFRHGMKRSPEYGIWCTLKARCLNPNVKCWPRYGGRGIRVCERWAESFAAFLADVGSRPGPGYSIDRIDNTGNYEPGNVRWVTAEEQSNNRRNNHLVDFDGRRQTIAQWAREYGVSQFRLQSRLASGWPVWAALTFPPGTTKREAIEAPAPDPQDPNRGPAAPDA